MGVDTSIEKWEKIIEADSLYSISNWGRVQTHQTKGRGTRNKNDMLTPMKGYDDHLCVNLKDKEGRLIQTRIIILVARYFVPNPNNNKYITLKDRNPNNVKAHNILWQSAATSDAITVEINKKLYKKTSHVYHLIDPIQMNSFRLFKRIEQIAKYLGMSPLTIKAAVDTNTKCSSYYIATQERYDFLMSEKENKRMIDTEKDKAFCGYDGNFNLFFESNTDIKCKLFDKEKTSQKWVIKVVNGKIQDITVGW